MRDAASSYRTLEGCVFVFSCLRCKELQPVYGVSPLLRVKIVHLVDRSEMFKIGGLVYDGGEIVKSQYCSLQGQRVLWRV